jgi:hypothetical protein
MGGAAERIPRFDWTGTQDAEGRFCMAFGLFMRLHLHLGERGRGIGGL